ncbi:hypothetical protein O6H91_Y041300 [Diphasiastrum complanatum]|nr:hypothetical protein O6H91_Y041300 [Diphasiastrum complanatum]
MLRGHIPQDLGLLKQLLYLNLSRNSFTGNIPSTLGNIFPLASLDLSSNQLYGEIPQSFSFLTSLAKINFSNNNLSGPIPQSRQLDTFSDSSYSPGNLGLCGHPLTRLCAVIPEENATHSYEGIKSFSDLVSLPGFALGICIGFSSVVLLFGFKRGRASRRQF